MVAEVLATDDGGSMPECNSEVDATSFGSPV